MPEMTPVADKIVPPDPQAGMKMLSSVLALRQQQQNLQTGQYQQQSAAAIAGQDQQRNMELKAAQALVLNGAKSGQYTTPDGTLDRMRMADDIVKVAPVYGKEVSSTLLSQANEIVSNKAAQQALTTDQKKELGAALGALAAKPDVSSSDVIDMVERLRQEHKDDPQFSRLLTSAMAHMPNAASPQQLQAGLSQWAAEATREPQASPSTMDTGTQIIPGQTNKFTGAFTPASGAVRKDIAGAVTQSGTATNDTERYNQISAGVAPSRQAITLADQIENLSNQVHTGKYSKAVTDFMAIGGQNNPEIAARQLISKYAAQLKTVATANAPTDSARAQIDAGFPDPEHMSPEAIRGAAEYIKGSMQMNLARASNARRFHEKHGGPSGIRVADDQLTANADPLMYTYRSLPAGAERQAFVKRHFANKAEAADFVQRMKAVEHYGGFEQ